jgi:2-isopropylmalate synthase
VVGAHARSVKTDIDMALECGVGFIGIFYCVSDGRLDGVFKKSLNKAIDQIAGMISYAKEQNPDLLIRYTPEDTVRSEFSNVLEASCAAVDAGADIISVADTTGYMIPGTDHNMYDYIKRLKDELHKKGHDPMIAVHCHNDLGMALANAMGAYRAGAEIIDASVLGLGERAGIVDLAQLIIALTDEFHEGQKWHADRLSDLYNLVSQYSGVPIPVNFPIIGKNAFTHCAGVHTHAAIKNPAHYQSLNPTLVGRKMQVSLDHMSGVSSLEWALDSLGIELEKDILMHVLEIVKSIGQKGRTVGNTELKHIVEWCLKHPANK